MLTTVSTTQLDEAARTALLTRLRSIEGLARGIRRTLEEGRDCQAVMDQLAALRAAAHAASIQALEDFALHCLHTSGAAPEQVVAQLVSTAARLTR